MEYILETNDLSISFGEHHVIQGVNFRVPKGKFLSIIGPNGAGKTTLFNMLSGQLKPSSGSIYFKGKDITNLPPAERTRLGIGRSFQLTNIFPDLTVLENVRMSIQSAEADFFSFFPKLSTLKQQREKAIEMLEKVQLDHRADAIAINLSHGEKRKLELAMLLALETELLLLDEPTAGISVEEVPAVLEVIKNIKKDTSKTIVLIEHKIDMMLELSDYLSVLLNGTILAEGNPEKIMQDERVQTAYLGGLYNVKSG